MANARVVGTIEAIGIPSVRHECGTVTGRRLTRGILLSMLILVLVLSVTTQATEDVLRLLIWEGYGPEEYVQSFEKKTLIRLSR